MIDFAGVPEIDQTQTPLAVAIKMMNEHAPLAEMFREVAASIPQQVPDAVNVPGWNYGSCRVVGRIGGFDHYSIENGIAPSDLDLSKIDYVGFYRQAVMNKNTGEIKYFYATIPIGSIGSASLGGTFEIKEDAVIPFGWNREEVETMARESLVKLQEMCAEFYNLEAV